MIFDQTIKYYRYNQVVDKLCIYKKIKEHILVFLVLYIDDILLIRNDVGAMSTVNYVLRIQIICP